MNLVEEVGRWEAEVDDRAKVPIPMDRCLVIEDVCADEDSSFSVRLVDGSILKHAPAPRKRSDVNHLSNCLFRRLKTFKASQLKGTSHLSNPAINCICKGYRWCVTANKGDPERARRQLLNMIHHYFGNHDHCRDDANEAGEPNVWCGFQREGPKYKYKSLPRGKPLQQIHERVVKKKTESGVEEETEEIDIKAGVLDVLNVFLTNNKLAAATSGKNSNVNESFHNTNIHMLVQCPRAPARGFRRSARGIWRIRCSDWSTERSKR